MECENNGYTLVECLIGLAIISVLSVFSYPSLLTLKDEMRFRTEMTNLVSSLQQAKIAAIRSNSFVVFQVKSTGYLVFEDNGAGGGVKGDWIQQRGEKILINCVLPAGINLTTNLTSGRTRFRGMPGMKAGTLVLQNINGKEAEIVISTVGKIRS